MTITTKFSIGDTVFCLINNKINIHVVTGIEITVGNNLNNTDAQTSISYEIYNTEGSNSRHENNLFATKEELLASL